MATLTGFSCQICRQRKVRCDQISPTCSNCAKASVACEYVAPVRGKRKRIKPVKEGMHAKLERYEKLLKSYGANLEQSQDGDESTDDESVAAPPSKRQSVDTAATSPAFVKDGPSPFEDGNVKIIRKDGSSRYFDSSFWSRADEEFRGDEQTLDDAVKNGIEVGCAGVPRARRVPVGITGHAATDTDGDADLLLGMCAYVQDLATIHPSLEEARLMWDIFLERVDPIIKLIHTTTMWPAIQRTIEQPQSVAKDLEALVFTVYASIVSSMDDDECLSMLKESKAILFKRYRHASRQALINAQFVKTSSLMTLQAYVLYMVGSSGAYQNDSFYVLSGIALRLARRMGLHRDGSTFGFSPFETEMRRRLWWVIVTGDYRASEFAGTKPSMDLIQSDTKGMLNVEDEDLTPDMIEFPPERTGITTGVLQLMRCDLTQFLKSVGPDQPDNFFWDKLTGTALTPEEKDRKIDGLEDLVESKYVRYCDPSNHLHFFASILARSALCKIRLFAHNPRQFAEKGEKVPQRSRDVIWKSGSKMLEYGVLMHSSPNMKKFTWHLGTAYLWDTLLYVLIETRHRRKGPEVDKIWKSIESIFASYPQIFDSNQPTLYLAIGSWTLQVWEECAAARRADGLPDQMEPNFIKSLRQFRRANIQQSHHAVAPKPNGDVQETSSHNFEQMANDVFNPDPIITTDFLADIDATGSYDFSDLLSFDLDPNGWAQFDKILNQQVT